MVSIAWLPCGTTAIALGLNPVGYGVAMVGVKTPEFGSSLKPEIELPC